MKAINLDLAKRYYENYLSSLNGLYFHKSVVERGETTIFCSVTKNHITPQEAVEDCVEDIEYYKTKLSELGVEV